MKELSVIIVAYNEEDRIKRCLESIKWANEIIVVDGFSNDGTVDICKQYTEKIYQRKWDGFISQKNYALSLATKEWVLSLDADEELSELLMDEIKGVLENNDVDCDAYSMPRKTYYLGRWILHSGWYPDRKVRLIKKGAGVWGAVEPHDALIVKGRVCSLKHDILHWSFRNIAHHIQKLNYFTDSAALEIIKTNKRVNITDIIFHPIGMFIKMFLLKKGFLDGIQGFIAAAVSSFHVMMKYAKVWERTGGKK